VIHSSLVRRRRNHEWDARRGRPVGRRARLTAAGSSGEALGGGVYNGLIGLTDPPSLTLNGTTVAGNRVTGTTGITLHGGGIFSTTPVARAGSSITGNSPDNCVGC